MDVNIEQEGPQPQLVILADRSLCARYNVRIENVTRLIDTAIGGAPIGTLFEGECRFDIVARFAPEHLQSPQALARLPVYNAEDIPIPQAQVARIEIVDGQTMIARADGRRRLTVRSATSSAGIRAVSSPRRANFSTATRRFRRGIIRPGWGCSRTSNAPESISNCWFRSRSP
jgi:Cu/Ag efflux pump CusA